MPKLKKKEYMSNRNPCAKNKMRGNDYPHRFSFKLFRSSVGMFYGKNIRFQGFTNIFISRGFTTKMFDLSNSFSQLYLDVFRFILGTPSSKITSLSKFWII